MFIYSYLFIIFSPAKCQQCFILKLLLIFNIPFKSAFPLFNLDFFQIEKSSQIEPRKTDSQILQTKCFNSRQFFVCYIRINHGCKERMDKNKVNKLGNHKNINPYSFDLRNPITRRYVSVFQIRASLLGLTFLSVHPLHCFEPKESK